MNKLLTEADIIKWVKKRNKAEIQRYYPYDSYDKRNEILKDDWPAGEIPKIDKDINDWLKGRGEFNSY